MSDEYELSTITGALPSWAKTPEQAAEYARDLAELERLERVKAAIRALLDAEDGGWEYPDDNNRLRVLGDMLVEELDAMGAGRDLVADTLEWVRGEALYDLQWREGVALAPAAR